ncbi:MAG TPA: MBOAT family O-acyltransferase [Vicinamibacterales bacterium]|nr:MBOAT family O-acyltransferase [Vicinamibacterales bacterium]
MIFHSLEFFAFFVITLAAYWSVPRRAQNVLLLLASYIFYGWVHRWWPVLLFATTFVDYWSARQISEAVPDSRLPVAEARRRAWLLLSIIANLGLLGFYKYFGFFADNVAAAAAAFGWTVPNITLQVLLPAGISFYTFQSMSYTIDVYRGHAPARRSFIDIAAFVSFFPHLVAGPIMRATNLLPQIERERRFDVAAARDAAVLIVWGLFKKLVIADNVGTIANKVFALESPDFFVLWAGVFAFAIQIYADFSAYTDIARGVAKWYGFDLIRNFDHPYLASGPVDFWRRWNISLSTWFRDYVYIPLGGSRRGPWRNAANIMATFLVSGFWHGANWNYVLWGAYHGLLLIGGRAFSAASLQAPSPKSQAPRWLRPLQVVAMFVLTSIGWLIFRETELGQLWRDLQLTPSASTALGRDAGLYLFLLTGLYSLPLWIHDLWAESGGPSLVRAVDTEEGEVHWRRVAMQAVMCGLMMAAMVTLRSSSSLNFIYFAF